MSITVMKQALEALEELIKKTSGQAIYSFMETERRIALSACVGLREALAEQETVLPGGGHVPAVPVAVYGYCPECGGAGVMRERRPNGDDKCTNGHKYPSSKALAEQPAQQEPVAWKKKGAFHFCNQPPVDVEKWIPLFKSPTQHWQTWASLTDEEIETIHRSAWIQSTATLSDFARAIEAKLREKNNG